MSEDYLFRDSDGKKWTAEDTAAALRKVGAHDAEMIFVHTDVMFGTLNPTFKRKQYLDALYRALLSLNVPTLALPAFTYSFCNGEDFDVRSSPTSMGALNEYIRKQDGIIRSLDPLLSIAARGESAELFRGMPSGNALGPGSFFDRLHETSGVKFLFFGADFAETFTYVHHVEKVLEVPYRFDMSFTGNITDEAGNTFKHTQSIHTRCGGVQLRNYAHLKAEMQEKKTLLTARVGDLEAVCLSEKDAYENIVNNIRKDINYCLAVPFREDQLTHVYTHGKNGERVTHC